MRSGEANREAPARAEPRPTAPASMPARAEPRPSPSGRPTGAKHLRFRGWVWVRAPSHPDILFDLESPAEPLWKITLVSVAVCCYFFGSLWQHSFLHKNHGREKCGL